MAASPVWKVYRGSEYVASCKYAEDAACLVASLGEGASIRYNHKLVVWREGEEPQSAEESFDHVAEVVDRRVRARYRSGQAHQPGREDGA